MNNTSLQRRQFLAWGAALASAPALARRQSQPVVVVMCDGFGPDYLEQSPMPESASGGNPAFSEPFRAQCPR